MVKYTLSLGRNIGTTGTVTDIALSVYLDSVSRRFPSFSVMHGTGYWQGKPEATVYLTIFTDDTSERHTDILELARLYNASFNQDCVLVEKSNPVAWFESTR